MSSKFKMAPQFILRFAIFVRKIEICASVLGSFKDWATRKLLTNEFRWFASLHEGRMLAALFAQVCHSFHWQLILQWLGNGTGYLKVRLENKLSSKIENTFDNCILGIMITHLLDTPNQVTRRSLPGGVDGWA